MTKEEEGILDAEEFINDVKEALKEIFLETPRYPFSISTTLIYPKLVEKGSFERHKFGDKYKHRAIALALECIIADKEAIADGLYLRLFSHQGGGLSVCFVEMIDRKERFKHFQKK